jgi:putative modified peptide
MIKGTPSNDVMDAILNRLANDPVFREKMLGNPKAAFAEHGVELDDSKIPTVRGLPSMEEFKRNREVYRKKLFEELGYMPFFLC